MSTPPPRVFISYAHQTAESAESATPAEPSSHADWVLALADRLRDDGIDAVIDQYEQWPEKGWRGWMNEQLKRADWLLIVCTAEYCRRFDGNVPGDAGRGVRWESQHITQALYEEKLSNRRFVPVLPPGSTANDIPRPLRDWPTFRPADECGYDALYRLLTGQPETRPRALGTRRELAPRTVTPLGGAGASPATARTGPRRAASPTAGAAAAPGATTAASTASATTAIAPPLSAPAAESVSPYPGLAAFTAAQSRFFFGRDDDTRRVVDRLGETRLVSVVGGSGTGKSSLVAAGVVPALHERQPGLRCLRCTPQNDPFAQLAAALDRALPDERFSLGQPRTERIAQALVGQPAAALAEHLPAATLPVVCFFDQFEELFTQTPAASADAFQAVFAALRARPDVAIVLTLRHEFMHRLMAWLGGEAFAASLVPLEAIADEARLRAIIVQPASECGVAVENELLAQLVPAAHAMAGALPLLALTLAQLFTHRAADGGLTLAAYQAMGGLPKVVETAARDIDRLFDSSERLTRAGERLFAELATVIDELPTRRTADAARLRADADVGRLADALRAQGFLADPDGGQRAELAHETLLTHWPRLHDWCSRTIDKLALRRQAETAAVEWHKARQRSPGVPAARSTTPHPADLLRWTWERQKPALAALLALAPQLRATPDADFADRGIDAWRTLAGQLDEPLASFLDPEPLRVLSELESDATPDHRREEIGLRLNQMGDPRRGVGVNDAGLPDIAWVDVPPGEVTLDDDGGHFPVAAFRIARYPVTWAQYRAFVEAPDGYRSPHWWRGLAPEGKQIEPREPGNLRWAFANHPVINVSWFDALAFCRWLGTRLALGAGQVVRLPTEWEWQWVAQAGRAAYAYPWGNEWRPLRANDSDSGTGRTTAVGMYPLGSPIPLPVLDLAGNVWEWCLNPHDRPAEIRAGDDVPRVLRGGSWFFLPGLCRAARRDHYAPASRNLVIGFRVCCGSPIELLGAAPLNTVTLPT